MQLTGFPDNSCLLSQENNSVPENKIISAALAKEASLKKYMKRVMPFVQVVKVSSVVALLTITWLQTPISLVHVHTIYIAGRNNVPVFR